MLCGFGPSCLGLPIRFLTKEALEAIENKLGVFVGLNLTRNPRLMRGVTGFKLKLMSRTSLVGNLELVFSDQVWHKKVDY
jgi:hypothetical protein